MVTYFLTLYRKLNRIQEIQKTIVDMQVVPKVLPLLGRSNDEIIRETLALVSTILFNANIVVQVNICIDTFKISIIFMVKHSPGNAITHLPVHTRLWTSVGIIWWPNIMSPLDQRLVFASSSARLATPEVAGLTA